MSVRLTQSNFSNSLRNRQLDNKEYGKILKNGYKTSAQKSTTELFVSNKISSAIFESSHVSSASLKEIGMLSIKMGRLDEISNAIDDMKNMVAEADQTSNKIALKKLTSSFNNGLLQVNEFCSEEDAEGNNLIFKKTDNNSILTQLEGAGIANLDRGLLSGVFKYDLNKIIAEAGANAPAAYAGNNAVVAQQDLANNVNMLSNVIGGANPINAQQLYYIVNEYRNLGDLHKDLLTESANVDLNNALKACAKQEFTRRLFVAINTAGAANGAVAAVVNAANAAANAIANNPAVVNIQHDNANANSGLAKLAHRIYDMHIVGDRSNVDLLATFKAGVRNALGGGANPTDANANAAGLGNAAAAAAAAFKDIATHDAFDADIFAQVFREAGGYDLGTASENTLRLVFADAAGHAHGVAPVLAAALVLNNNGMADLCDKLAKEETDFDLTSMNGKLLARMFTNRIKALMQDDMTRTSEQSSQISRKQDFADNNVESLIDMQEAAKPSKLVVVEHIQQTKQAMQAIFGAFMQDQMTKSQTSQAIERILQQG